MPRQRTREATTFTFKPRWKEELVCTAAGGSLVLEFSMGSPAAYLPTQEQWRGRCPEWARELWPELHADLKAWCYENHARFVVEAGASVWSDAT